MAIAREAEPVGSLNEIKEAGLDREDLLGIYRPLLLTRGIEGRGHILYKQGKNPGSFYTGRGNEAAAVGVATAMGPEDVGAPLHRDMGVHITRGVEPWRIFANYMGKRDGPTRGKDGNVHMADARLGLIAMVSHLPAMLPVAVDGTDVLAVYRETKRAIEKARDGGGPTLIECLTLRMEGHAVHDDAFYVPKEMFEEWAKSDPLERYRTWLQEHAELSGDEEDEINAQVKKLLNDALQRAEESPLPEPQQLLDGVYATPEDLDTPHHK